jgi:hypothetical protein
MQVHPSTQLFTELTSEESATVNGACQYYYHNPYAYNPYYEGAYQAGYGAGYGSGYGYGYSQASSVTQTTNVNVVIED